VSGQVLDLKQSAQIVWRRKGLVGAVTALGLLAGVAFTALSPAVYSSSALVALSPTVNISSQDVIATGAPVLSLALPNVGPGLSVNTLHSRVQAGEAASGLMSISATCRTPAEAIKTANAVARSYVAYVGSAGNVVGPLPAQMFQPATSATGTPLAVRLFYAAGPGVLSGVLIGIIIALAIGSNDRRLRGRDEIADSIGVPVLASVRVRHPAKAESWAKLLADYEPKAADAWRLRTMLHRLGPVDVESADPAAGSGSSVAVLSLSGDRGALALGPQLAVFAAAQGIRTALVISPQPDADTAAALCAACAAPPGRSRVPGNLNVSVSDQGDAGPPPKGMLTVVVAVVDSQAPRVGNTMRAATTVLGVASGAVTAQQLARVAASAAADGRDIAGVLVADPDPADQTTGRLPQLARPGQHRMPTRMSSAVTEIVQ